MIEVKHLVKTYPARGGILKQKPVQAVKGVSFVLPDAGAVAFIGESGCGKTTIGRILTGLESYDSGEVLYDGVNLTRLPSAERREKLRKVQLIQQDPYAALNPSRTIAKTLMAPLALEAKRQQKSKAWMASRAREVLALVGLNPEVVLPKYPHMLSGGQRQRVVIARALTVEPDVLVADEAVSMIDVSLRLGILSLLLELRNKHGIAILFITHDVAAARYVGQDGRVCVIYQGEVVEEGVTDDLIQSPVHPYSQALLSAVPVLRGLEAPGPDRYIPLGEFQQDEGTACRFAPRCRYAEERCRTEKPRTVPYGNGGHRHRCHFPVARRVVAEPLEVNS
ncbi:oligopeptide transport ATP-binding protein OppF [Peptococcaceae bacterium CEB3]|nr:oligopeptide transport ATP-binding protein OppF [Peptococcaceae bacterium CEB3]